MVRSFTLRPERSGSNVKMHDANDQSFVWITGMKFSGLGLWIFGYQDNNADQAITVIARPFQVCDPFFANAA